MLSNVTLSPPALLPFHYITTGGACIQFPPTGSPSWTCSSKDPVPAFCIPSHHFFFKTSEIAFFLRGGASLRRRNRRRIFPYFVESWPSASYSVLRDTTILPPPYHFFPDLLTLETKFQEDEKASSFYGGEKSPFPFLSYAFSSPFSIAQK